MHYMAQFSKTEVESDKILRKLSDKDHCDSSCGHSLPPSDGGSNSIISESWVTDIKYRNVRKQPLFARLADSERFPVLNVFFVLELTKRLPSNSPVIVIAANPGLCKSQLKRNLPFPRRMAHSIMELLLAHTAEEGSRQLVWAAVGGAGRESELRGGFVSGADLQEVSEYVLSDEGAVVQTRLWVSSRHALS